MSGDPDIGNSLAFLAGLFVLCPIDPANNSVSGPKGKKERLKRFESTRAREFDDMSKRSIKERMNNRKRARHLPNKMQDIAASKTDGRQHRQYLGRRLGKLGAASKVRRIDPATGEVIDDGGK